MPKVSQFSQEATQLGAEDFLGIDQKVGSDYVTKKIKSETAQDTATLKSTGSTTRRSSALRWSEVRNIRDFGAVSDGTDARSSIVAALSAWDAIRITSGVYTIASDLTINAGKLVIFEPGAKLKPASGVTITLNCEVEAGRWEIFDYTASGKVLFGFFSRTRALFPEWYGALADNSTDCATAFSRLFDSSFTSSENPQKIELNEGYYICTTGFSVRQNSAMYGCPGGKTRLVFAPTATGTLITLPADGSNIIFEDIQFHCTNTTAGRRTTAIAHSSSSHQISGLSIRRCLFSNFNQYAIYLGGAQYVQICDQTVFLTISNHTSIGGNNGAPATCIYGSSFFNQIVIGHSVKALSCDQLVYATQCASVTISQSSSEHGVNAVNDDVAVTEHIHLEGRSIRVVENYFEGIKTGLAMGIVVVQNADAYDLSSNNFTGFRAGETDTMSAIFIRVSTGCKEGRIATNSCYGTPANGWISVIASSNAPFLDDNTFKTIDGGFINISDTTVAVSFSAVDFRASNLWHIITPLHHRTYLSDDSVTRNVEFSHIRPTGGASAGMGVGHKFTATNGAGSEAVLGDTAYAWTDPTSTLENASFTLRLAASGTVSNAIQADANATTGNTRFLLYDVTSGTLQRVKVGANSTGPSGTGRALYIDNA